MSAVSARRETCIVTVSVQISRLLWNVWATRREYSYKRTYILLNLNISVALKGRSTLILKAIGGGGGREKRWWGTGRTAVAYAELSRFA